MSLSQNRKITSFMNDKKGKLCEKRIITYKTCNIYRYTKYVFQFFFNFYLCAIFLKIEKENRDSSNYIGK